MRLTVICVFSKNHKHLKVQFISRDTNFDWNFTLKITWTKNSIPLGDCVNYWKFYEFQLFAGTTEHGGFTPSPLEILMVSQPVVAGNGHRIVDQAAPGPPWLSWAFQPIPDYEVFFICKPTQDHRLHEIFPITQMQNSLLSIELRVWRKVYFLVSKCFIPSGIYFCTLRRSMRLKNYSNILTLKYLPKIKFDDFTTFDEEWQPVYRVIEYFIIKNMTIRINCYSWESEANIDEQASSISRVTPSIKRVSFHGS